MNHLNHIKTIIDIWMDGVARTVRITLDRFSSPRSLRIFEQDNGSFRFEVVGSINDTIASIQIFDGPLQETLPPNLATLINGTRTELVLHPKHFIFRSLELPRRATEFLDGIIRAQIDRLTPWTAQDAAYGYMTEAEDANNRIELTIAATARTVISPYMRLLSKFGAQSAFVSTQCEKADATIVSIKIAENVENIGSRGRIQRMLLVSLLGTVAATAAVILLTAIIGIAIANKQADLSRRINTQRAAILAERGTPVGSETARQALSQSKGQTPSSLILLEVLSRVLPDNTYLTELRIQGNKMQITGMTHNAPSLISLLEKSSHFNHATFFAPTTLVPNDPREHFHIEANILPRLVPGT